MVTAVDTNVLADLLLDDREHREASHAALLRCREEGPLIAGEVVVAEITALLGGKDPLQVLRTARITFVPMGLEGASAAGRAWSAFRGSPEHGGRVVADFLIAAHALENAERLLTRDRGFYRSAFRKLRVIEP